MCSDRYVDITGCARMQQRPIAPLVQALRSAGGRIDYLGVDGCLPLRVYGGGIRGGVITLSSRISSQYVSSILMIAPLLAADTVIVLEEAQPTSLPYITMTIHTMSLLGAVVDFDPAVPSRFTVHCGGYVGARVSMPPIFTAGPSAHDAEPGRSGLHDDVPVVVTVEPDASSATYFAALAAVTGRTVHLLGVGSSSCQGMTIACVFRRRGCATDFFLVFVTSVLGRFTLSTRMHGAQVMRHSRRKCLPLWAVS
jgi:5-enolpyruvylshikimate-3-phosphate synthase